jgi:hypothetical protein
MIEHSFRLIPFVTQDIPAISLNGTFSFQNHFLTLRYSLAGEIESVLVPPASLTPGRKDELWKGTCFEFFLSSHDQPGYWEFNMSPSGDWNAYRMDAYRRIGFREETAIPQLSFEFRRVLDRVVLEAAVDLAPIVRPEAQLLMGITAVIRMKDGSETYWALVHPAPYADFHLWESFILPLAGQTHPLGQSAPDG